MKGNGFRAWPINAVNFLYIFSIIAFCAGIFFFQKAFLELTCTTTSSIATEGYLCIRADHSMYI